MVKSMKYGSIIYDLAVSQGGNSAFSDSDKINIVNGVKIYRCKKYIKQTSINSIKFICKKFI